MPLFTPQAGAKPVPDRATIAILSSRLCSRRSQSGDMPTLFQSAALTMVFTPVAVSWLWLRWISSRHLQSERRLLLMGKTTPKRPKTPSNPEKRDKYIYIYYIYNNNNNKPYKTFSEGT